MSDIGWLQLSTKLIVLEGGFLKPFEFNIRPPCVFLYDIGLQQNLKKLKCKELKSGYVDHEAIANIALENTLIRFIHLLNGNRFDAGHNVMFGAEV